MAKTKHNNFIDTVVEISQDAKERGVMQLYTEDLHFDGRHIRINGKDVCHFGTTSYLSLGHDIRLKKAASEAIFNFGTQFPLSKTYLSHSVYLELEEKLMAMYGHPVIVTKNSTLGHLGIIPTIVRDEDAIILDHQVHWSVQNAALISKSRGVKIEMIRHNNLEMLEYAIKKLSPKADKIWYFADGVYSMYGDVAPVGELMQLSKKYPQLHIYFDDVHGMSWTGKNGTGYINSCFDELPENVVIIGTLSKTFGASGAFMVTSNNKFYKDVKNFGGPLTFSAQLEPSAVAAASASASIHLSDEIHQIQKELSDKIMYCNSLIRETNLPLIEENNCPVFYIGAGTPDIGFNMTKKLMEEGFFVNTGIFPAVPVKNTGTRFTISRSNTKEDIKALIDCISYHHPKIIAKAGYTENKVRKCFNLPLLSDEIEEKISQDLTLQIYSSIEEVNQQEWDHLFTGTGLSDYNGIRFMENYFKGNKLPEENWDFRFLIIRDQKQEIILATYFTNALWKDDTLAAHNISEVVEEQRQSEPYYMTSQVLSIGSLITEGKMFYFNKNHESWDAALDLFLKGIEQLDEELNPAMITLRDFHEDNADFKRVLFDKGFIKIDLPDSCTLDLTKWTDDNSYLQSLSAKSRRNFKKDVAPFLKSCTTKYVQNPDEKLTKHCYGLVKSVSDKNFDLNTFLYSEQFFKEFMKQDNSELLLLYLNESLKKDQNAMPCAALFCYSSHNTYIPVYIGIEYQYNEDFSIYRQMLYQAIKRAKTKKCDVMNMGFSAAFEKKKLGAKLNPTCAFLQAKDNFTIEAMGIMQDQNR